MSQSTFLCPSGEVYHIAVDRDGKFLDPHGSVYSVSVSHMTPGFVRCVISYINSLWISESYNVWCGFFWLLYV